MYGLQSSTLGTSPHCLAFVQGSETSTILVDLLYAFCCCVIRWIAFHSNLYMTLHDSPFLSAVFIFANTPRLHCLNTAIRQTQTDDMTSAPSWPDYPCSLEFFEDR